MDQAENLVSKSEYARMRGCSPATVTKALKTGRISAKNGRIDPKAADQQWGERTKEGVNGSGEKRPVGRPPKDPDEAPAEGIDYYEARARREHFGAKLAEIEVDRASAALVERSTVESAVFEAFRALRDRVMAAPRRCAPTVAPLTDLREIEAVFADELRRSFEAFEQHISEQLAARMAPK